MIHGENPPITDDVRTPPPPGPMRLMDEGEYRRFVNHMLWLVMDEAEPLRDLGNHMLEHVGGTTMGWGPWPPQDCAELLVRWFDSGLVTLYSVQGPFPESEARALLAVPSRWHAEAGPFEPYIGATAKGVSTTDAEWFSIVEDLRTA